MSEGIGASITRKEDKKFLTGKGRYTDDINRAGQVYAHFVRSDVAHANIKSIDTKDRIRGIRCCRCIYRRSCSS